MCRNDYDLLHQVICSWQLRKSNIVAILYRAIRYAQSQANSFDDTRFALHNPCTTVYKLVRLLRGEDQEFNKTANSLYGRSIWQ